MIIAAEPGKWFACFGDSEAAEDSDRIKSLVPVLAWDSEGYPLILDIRVNKLVRAHETNNEGWNLLSIYAAEFLQEMGDMSSSTQESVLSEED